MTQEVARKAAKTVLTQAIGAVAVAAAIWLIDVAFAEPPPASSDPALTQCVEGAVELGGKVSSMDAKASCGEPKPAQSFEFGTGEFWLDHWSRISCDDLFSPTVPARIYDKAAQPWFPLCSMGELRRQRFSGKKADFLTAHKKSMAEWKRQDYCERDASEMSDQEGYAAPTREDSGLDLMPGHGDKAAEPGQYTTKDYLADVAKIQVAVTQRCCAEDVKCADLMRAVKVELCEPKSDPTESDECINGGVFELTDEQVERNRSFFKQPLTESQAKGKFPFPPLGESTGGITLSPLIDPESGRPNDDLDVIAHEMGHACSDIQLALAVDRGTPGAVASYRLGLTLFDKSGKAQQGCMLLPKMIESYRGLYKQMGASGETFACMAGRSGLATHARLTPSKACANGCPTLHLEESFADWISFWETPEAVRIPTLTPDDWCSRVRDNVHPYGLDELACFLKTPTFAARMRKETQCVQ